MQYGKCGRDLAAPPMELSDEALCRRAADGSREAEEALSGAIPGGSCARPLLSGGRRQRGPDAGGDVRAHPAIREYDRRQRPRPSGPLPRCASATASFPRSRGLGDKHSPLNQSVPLDTPFFDGKFLSARRLRASSADPEELIIDTRPRGRGCLRAPESSCPSSRQDLRVVSGRSYLPGDRKGGREVPQVCGQRRAAR